VVVASIDTYLKYAEAVGASGLVSRPTLVPGEAESIIESRPPSRRVTRRK
jgi:hypothetical protein